MNKKNILRGGDTVKVKPFEEILKTLDSKGTLDGLPFMPEMKQFCGRTFSVHKHAQHLCTESGNRFIKDTVLLQNVRCDGGFHDGCKQLCMIMWKEAWLQKNDNKREIVNEKDSLSSKENTHFPTKNNDRYFCQATEIINASIERDDLPKVQHIFFLVQEWRYKNERLVTIINIILKYILWKLGIIKANPICKEVNGELSGTPSQSLNLKAGERVRVKSEAEILKTLDKSGRNRGMGFTGDMFDFCGREFIVKDRSDKIIHEHSGKMVELKDTVILEDVVCKGQCRVGCARSLYHFWREIWLERV
jgi:hypothetical protein